MMITKKRLPRRMFLHGIGAAVGLPLLDSMIPALAAADDAVAKPARRITFIYLPNGMMMDKWTPVGEGSAFEMTQILEPLAPFRNQLLLLSGLAHAEGHAEPGEAGGDHARAASSYLTGVHAKRTEGVGLQLGVSLDQIAAKQLGRHTQLASLELAIDTTTTIGDCESGYSCAYTNTISWRTPTTPMPMEYHPRAVFENLFGDSDSTDPKVRLARIENNRSVLDAVTQGANSLMNKIGASDRNKLNEYFDAIRDVERRIHLAQEQTTRELPTLDRPVGIPETFEEHAKIMYDLQVLAYQTDLTRVTTFMTGHETTTRSYAEIGIPDSHHPVSHHAGNPERKSKLARINTHHSKALAYFLQKLKSTPDGDGSLLDHCVILYGSGLSDSNLHTHDNLPVLLAGGGAGKLKGGRHLRYTADTPMTRLYGTLLDMVDVPVESLETKRGKLEPLSIA